MTTEKHKGDGPKPNSYDLIVNGRERTVHEKKQAYRDIARLAYAEIEPRD